MRRTLVAMAHFEASPGGTPGPTQSLAALGQSKGLRVTFGVITVLIGLLVLIWPGLTILTAAVLFGVQLLITGVFWLVSTFTTDGAGTGQRVLFAVAGLLSLLAGILCLRAPFQTIAVLALLLGAIWVVGGVAEIFHGFGTSGWAVFSGVVTVIAGIVVLVAPLSSMVALAWLFGITLLVLGILSIAAAVSDGRAPAPKTSADHTTGHAAPA
ncbi:putative membrane protein [Saccharothrix espanaensis DSM 44229]|uniref:Putative membrane protein n=2 Tax=Saccharothrix espanaensis TaxID=103731 RepID=K0JS22_SACES|nr:putative membrane protein [Saccharothrix espanaensis DSM 44229]